LAPIIWVSCNRTSSIVFSDGDRSSTRLVRLGCCSGAEAILAERRFSGGGFTSFMRFNMSTIFGAEFLEAFCNSSNLSALKSSAAK
jgi:hypothetical protein